MPTDKTPEESMAVVVRRHLEKNTYLHGRLSHLTIEQVGDTIVISGRLPSFHLKQLLQEAMRKIPGVTRFENRTVVASSHERIEPETGVRNERENRGRDRN